MGHLNAERLQRLLKDPRQEGELYAHLANGCDECEAFLAASPCLDGLTDVALLSSAPAAGARADDPRAEETFRRIRPARTRRRWLVALAAMLLAVVAVWLLRGRDDDRGLKGLLKVQVELQAVVKGPAGELTRLAPGQAVAPGGTLLLRYHASESAPATLVIQRGERREVLGTVQLEAGTHDLTRDGALLGISLEGEHGPVRIRVETVDSGPAAQLDLRVE